MRCRLSTAWLVYAVAWSLAGTAQGADPRLVNDVIDMVNRGWYDDAIESASPAIAASPNAEPILRYARGLAYWHIAWFGAAEGDFAPLGAYSPSANTPPASTYLHKIWNMKQVSPKKVHEIRKLGHVIFRVYYDAKDPLVLRVLGALPKANAVVSDLFGTKVIEVAVFVFDTSQKQVGFCRAWLGDKQTLSSWAWAQASNGILLFCTHSPDGTILVSDIPDTRLKATVTHEYAHCLVTRVVGNAGLPIWMHEGLAMFAESKVDQEVLDRNDLAMEQVLGRGAVMPLEDISDRPQFLKTCKAERAGSSKTQAYQQSLSMVRYLLSGMRRGSLPRFLRLIRTTSNIDVAFRQAFGSNMVDFYQAWLRHLRADRSGKTGPSNPRRPAIPR